MIEKNRAHNINTIRQQNTKLTFTRNDNTVTVGYSSTSLTRPAWAWKTRLLLLKEIGNISQSSFKVFVEYPVCSNNYLLEIPSNGHSSLCSVHTFYTTRNVQGSCAHYLLNTRTLIFSHVQSAQSTKQIWMIKNS